MSAFVLWGCPKKADVTSAPEAPAAQEAAPAQPEEPAAATAAPETPAAAEAEPEPKETAAAAGAALQPIYFDFDRSFIRDDAKAAMRANADWLKANPQARIRIEGNCDERGTVEYNQALGQRRAQSAKKYLTDLGIAATRISLISYGKERPVCSESTEECWQQNRRDDLVVVEE
jgi:peptidoglycan-associated lipoprotein